jgi:hypothetical protein
MNCQTLISIEKGQQFMYLVARLQVGIAPLFKPVYYESWFLRGIATFPVTGRIRFWLPM